MTTKELVWSLVHTDPKGDREVVLNAHIDDSAPLRKIKITGSANIDGLPEVCLTGCNLEPEHHQSESEDQSGMTSLSELYATIPEDDMFLLAQYPNGLVRAFRNDIDREWLKSEAFTVKASGLLPSYKATAQDIIYSYYVLWFVKRTRRDGE